MSDPTAIFHPSRIKKIASPIEVMAPMANIHVVPESLFSAGTLRATKNPHPQINPNANGNKLSTATKHPAGLAFVGVGRIIASCLSLDGGLSERFGECRFLVRGGTVRSPLGG